MTRQKLFVGLALTMACLLGAARADAGSSCITRSNCRPLARQYVARAHTSCLVVVPVPLCAQHSSSCGTAVANCDFRRCPIGGAQARATNGPAGCVATSARTGLGLAGDLSFEGAGDATLDENESGEGETLTNARFDAAAQTVEVRLESGRLAATPGGLGQRLTAWVFLDDTTGEEDEETDPEPTAANTLWEGIVMVENINLRATGFDPTAFALSTDEKDRTVATFNDVVALVDLGDLSAADFDRVVVKVLVDEVAP